MASPVGRSRRARAQVAALLGCEPDSVVFTASGSEADNLAIKGVAFARLGQGDHIITSAIEHPAVLGACRYLERRFGYRLTILPVDGFGTVDPEDVRRAIEPGTVLVSVMHANNEVGTLEPIAEIAGVAREHRIVCHTDAAQSVGKVPVDVDELGVDLLTVTGHKLYAPKGVGALYVRPGTRLDSLIHGAGHEHGMRAGTENVPYIVGLGAACALAAERLRAGGARAGAASARPTPRRAAIHRARPRAERASRAATAEHAERQLPRPGRREPARAHALGGRCHRLSVPLGTNRAVPGADRHGPRRSAGARRGASEPRPSHHGGRRRRGGNRAGRQLVHGADLTMTSTSTSAEARAAGSAKIAGDRWVCTRS